MKEPAAGRALFAMAEQPSEAIDHPDAAMDRLGAAIDRRAENVFMGRSSMNALKPAEKYQFASSHVNQAF